MDSDKPPRKERLKDDARTLGSNVFRLFKGSPNRTPAEEALAIASGSAAASAALEAFAERNQQRLHYWIRWLSALQDVGRFAEEAFGQVAEEAVVDEETEEVIPADFTTSTAGETEKVAGTEPPPPMNRAQRRAAAAEGRPMGPPAGPSQSPPKDKGSHHKR